MDLKNIVDDFKETGKRLKVFEIEMVTLEGPFRRYEGDDYCEYAFSEPETYSETYALDDLISKCLEKKIKTVYARPVYVTAKEVQDAFETDYEHLLERDYNEEIQFLNLVYPNVKPEDYYGIYDQACVTLHTCKENRMKQYQTFEGDFVGYRYEAYNLNDCIFYTMTNAYIYNHLFTDYDNDYFDIRAAMIERIDAAVMADRQIKK